MNNLNSFFRVKYLPVMLLCVAVLFLVGCDPVGHGVVKPLDRQNPVRFYGSWFVYEGDTVRLSEKALYIDGSLPQAMADTLDYVFTSFNDAAARFVPGTEDEPMCVYIAPWVYWIDDPDDPVERVPRNGGTPYGLEVNCPWLRLIGLNPDPANVVLACNRGQTQGADGNFTMFHFTGNGFYATRITFGNYCNIDLEFPLKPSLGRPKRFEAITQAQLAIMNGDRIMAEHCRFVSRLNLCPLLGGRRTFFYDCHFESTNDALTGSAVYLDCDFDFYGSQPFGAAGDQGAVLLNSTFHVMGQKEQYFAKMGGQVVIVDGRFESEDPDVLLGWTETPTYGLRCYQCNVTLNGRPVMMHASQPWLTVDMTGKPVLGAFRLEYEGRVVYNTYNLLRGNDDWDPMHVKEVVAAASARDGCDYASMATALSVSPSSASVETGSRDVVLSARSQTMNRRAQLPFGASGGFGMGVPSAPPELPDATDLLPLTWQISALPDWTEQGGAVPQAVMDSLSPQSVRISGDNQGEESVTVYVRAVTPEGLEGAAAIAVAPSQLPPPAFVAEPVVREPSDGLLHVDYALDLQGRADQSLITWYRAADAAGTDAVPVAVSRLDKPCYTYKLQSGDVGCYLLAEVAPQHIRSSVGTPLRAVMTRPVAVQDLHMDAPNPARLAFADLVLPEKSLRKTVKDWFHTDFADFPASDQRAIRPGYWTLGTYKPADITKYSWQASPAEGWMYGSGEGGAVGTGLLQRTKGARMLYTPVEGRCGDMYVRLNVDPCKAAGQGFGSATSQYMDVYIKFSTETLTGYALRIERTTKYADAVDFVLMKYENGLTQAVSEPVSASCFRTGCSIVLGMSGSTLKAHVETRTEHARHASPDVVKVVNLEAEVESSDSGGTGVQHTGTTGASATMLHEMEVVWFEP